MLAEEQDACGNGSRVGHGPSGEDRRRADPAGDWAPLGGSFADRDMGSVPALDVGRNVRFFSLGPLATPVCDTKHETGSDTSRRYQQSWSSSVAGSCRFVTTWQEHPEPWAILLCLGHGDGSAGGDPGTIR